MGRRGSSGIWEDGDDEEKQRQGRVSLAKIEVDDEWCVCL